MLEVIEEKADNNTARIVELENKKATVTESIAQLKKDVAKIKETTDHVYYEPENETVNIKSDNTLIESKCISIHGNIELDGTINEINTDDIITKNNIKDHIPDSVVSTSSPLTINSRDIKLNYDEKTLGVVDNKLSVIGQTGFSDEGGYPYFTVKNEHITYTSKTEGDIKYSSVIINLPDEIKNALSTISTPTKVFEIKIRKNIIFTDSGKCIKKYDCIFDGTNWKTTKITFNKDSGKSYFTTENSVPNSPMIWIDEAISYFPYQMYMEGDLSFIYVLAQESIKSNKSVVKCEIIDAKNAFKLHESDVYYLYTPTATEERVDNIDYWKMFWEIPDSYTIPRLQPFVFKDRAFDNTYSLTYNPSGENQLWEGNNIRNRYHGGVISKYKEFAIGIIKIYMKHTDENKHVFELVGIPIKNDNYAFSVSPKIKWIIEEPDGRTTNLTSMEYLDTSSKLKKDGYDYVTCKATNRGGAPKGSKLKGIIEVEGGTIELLYIIQTSMYDILDVDFVYETIEGLNINYERKIERKIRNIEIFMRKDSMQQSSEIGWDGKQNPFQYLLDCKFYEVFPNPNACTTLYTDYNITSSKIITADNITTMAANLNIVSNTADVMGSEITTLRAKINKVALDFQMYTEKIKWDNDGITLMQIVSGVAMVLGGGMKIMEFGLSNVGSIAFKYGRLEGEMELEDIYGNYNNLPDLPIGRSVGDIATDPIMKANHALSAQAVDYIIKKTVLDLGYPNIVLKKDISQFVTGSQIGLHEMANNATISTIKVSGTTYNTLITFENKPNDGSIKIRISCETNGIIYDAYLKLYLTNNTMTTHTNITEYEWSGRITDSIGDFTFPLTDIVNLVKDITYDASTYKITIKFVSSGQQAILINDNQVKYYGLDLTAYAKKTDLPNLTLYSLKTDLDQYLQNISLNKSNKIVMTNNGVEIMSKAGAGEIYSKIVLKGSSINVLSNSANGVDYVASDLYLDSVKVSSLKDSNGNPYAKISDIKTIDTSAFALKTEIPAPIDTSAFALKTDLTNNDPYYDMVGDKRKVVIGSDDTNGMTLKIRTIDCYSLEGKVTFYVNGEKKVIKYDIPRGSSMYNSKYASYSLETLPKINETATFNFPYITLEAEATSISLNCHYVMDNTYYNKWIAKFNS